jgi:hypothetical protein
LLFILAKVVAEQFSALQLFADDPHCCIVDSQVVGEIHLFIELLLVFEDDSDWLPLAKAVVGWVGHHDQTSENVNLILQHFWVEHNLSVDLSVVN